MELLAQEQLENLVKDYLNLNKSIGGHKKYTLQQCIQSEYDLFVVQSLKGSLIELKALEILSKVLPELQFEEAEGYLDDELRIDILVKNTDENLIGGIQVKPKTFKSMRSEVLFMQNKQNKKWDYPVWFLFYNKDESFHELEKLIELLKS